MTNLLQTLSIPYAALLTIILGMMALSFPIGAMLVFDSDIGGALGYDYPLGNIGIPGTGGATIAIQAGDAFVVLWSAFAILFAIALAGPRRGVGSALSSTLVRGSDHARDNYAVSAVTWFAILAAASSAIIIVQGMLGSEIEVPQAENRLLFFLGVMGAPFLEEALFRVLLIGVPLYVMYAQKNRARQILKSLWHPRNSLGISAGYRVTLLIAVSAILFGASHIIPEGGWNEAKFAQAAVSGAILGWVYVGYGLLAAILVHWAANYFVFSYLYLIAELGDLTVAGASSHGLASTMEIMLIVLGALSAAMIILRRIRARERRPDPAA